MKKILFTMFCLFYILAGHAEALVLKLPLYKFTPARTIDLKCITGEYSIQIPIPERWNLNKVSLSFSYTNSSNLLQDNSQLVVSINGRPVMQRNFNPMSPDGSVSLDIPVDLLKAGYNNLNFRTTQHYKAGGCENPCSPDLWTIIYLDKANLEIDYNLKEVPLKLSELAAYIFDPKIFPFGEINVIGEDLSSESVTMEGIVAAGIARRFDYKKINFNVSNNIRHELDNVLIGKKVFVETFLKNYGIALKEIKGPYLKVIHLPSKNGQDLSHALIIVTGVTSKDVKIASETLTNLTISYPAADEMTPMELSLPEISQYSGRLIVSSDKKYDFKTLNFPIHTFEGFSPSSREITFRLPADFLIKQNKYAELTLNFVYGAGLRPDSVLNIKVNDKSVRSVQLKSYSGDMIEGYKISIPTYLFKAGTNTISFSPLMAPIAKECDLIMSSNLFLTIFENSTLYFPPMPHFVELPALELFMLNGFPFTRWPDGYEAMIYLAHPDEKVVASALNIIGLMTQKNGYPLFGIEINTKAIPSGYNGELIVMGDIKSIPPDIKKASPLSLTTPSTVPYPLVRDWEGEETYAVSKQVSDAGANSGIVSEFQSPYKEGRSTVMITATSTDALKALCEALLEPHVQAAALGDILLVDLNTAPEYKVTAMRAGHKYTSGKLGKISKIDFYVSSYPYLYYVAIVLIILAVSFSIFFILKKARKRRLEGNAA